MKIYKINLALLVMLNSIITTFSTGSLASESVPDVFKGQDQNSTLSIAYDDYNKILKESVWDLGRSDRAIASKPKPITGSKMPQWLKRKTIMEGNRFYFENFKDKEMKMAIAKIRIDLEQLPDEVAL